MINLSVVVPFKDDILNLKQCINAIEKQKTGYRYEIIIADDGSSQDYSKEINSLKIKNLRYFYQKNKGPAAARNLGIKKSKSKLVAFVDSDCIPKKNWINLIVESYRKNKDFEILGGKVEADKKNLCALASQFLTSNAMRDDINGKKKLIFLPTCNIAIKKSVFMKTGYFDEDFKYPAGEDLEFCWRAFKKGIPLNYDERIVVFHNLKNSLNSYIKQAYRYGRGNYLVKIKHPDQPELKSIRLGNKLKFYFGCFIDLLDGPRFAYIFTRRLTSNYKKLNPVECVFVFCLYLIHKSSYVLGNLAQAKAKL
jgi:GT2 family glycosyltransferase